MARGTKHPPFLSCKSLHQFFFLFPPLLTQRHTHTHTHTKTTYIHISKWQKHQMNRSRQFTSTQRQKLATQHFIHFLSSFPFHSLSLSPHHFTMMMEQTLLAHHHWNCQLHAPFYFTSTVLHSIVFYIYLFFKQVKVV